MAFYRFTLVYIFDGPKARVKVKIKALKVAKVKIKILLPLIKAFLASLFLPIRARF